MYREKRPAKYLEDLNVYTKRQIKILYFNGYGRDPTDKELKDLLAKADAQDDFENIQFILNNYNCDRIDDNEDDDYDDSPSEPPAPKEEIDALFDEIRASCVGPVKPHQIQETTFTANHDKKESCPLPITVRSSLFNCSLCNRCLR